MPSIHSQKCNAGSWNRSTFPAKAPHFFKIVHRATVEKQKLRIPPKFVRKYGKNLSNTVFLKVPSGAKWQVELIRCDGEVWLYKGWKDFADYYSIGYGHFLVFKYDGNSHFHLLIFDKSASEIEYRCKETKLEESEDDVSVEIMDDFPYTRKEKTPLKTTVQQCKMTTNKDNNCQQLALLSPSYGTASTRVKLETTGFSEAKVFEKRQAATASAIDKARALERAKAFKYENPCFIVTMQPSYVGHSFKLNIPLAFVRKHFTKKHKNVTLRVADKKTWSAKYCLGSTYSRLYGGWREFSEENNLRIGDVCVFELNMEVENSLKVVIFRAIEGAT